MHLQCMDTVSVESIDQGLNRESATSSGFRFVSSSHALQELISLSV
jgi:hypothetical protein